MAGAQGAERARIRDELITGHLPLANHIARKFARRGQPLEDLEQVARLGLVNAVDRFDPQRDKPFLAFAVPTIMGEVRRYFRDTGWSLSVPRRLKELHLRITAESEQLRQRLGRSPTPSELATVLGLSIDEVYEGIEAANAYQLFSIDHPGAGSDQPGKHPAVTDTLGDDDAALAMVENVASLRPLISKLPARERLILALRFSGDLTQSQIADRVGLSQMHVSRLLAKTLAQLRSDIEA
nr:RNA polymerase sigma factor SigF [Labedaea rhizosphaerae]